MSLSILRYAVEVLLRALFVPEWILRVSAVSLLEYCRWKSFLTEYHIKKFITAGDFGFKQISRNILLKQACVESWFYLDTENLGGLNFVPADQPSFRHHFWGYLYYDHFVAWSDRIVRYHQIHQQRISNYHTVGCLWSEHIRMVREGEISTDLPEQLRSHGLKPHHKIVAVFDSTYSRHARTNYQDGLDFAKAIHDLLEALPDIFVIWKEKKPRVRNSVTDHMSHWGHEFSRLIERYDEMAKHPRCWFPGYAVSSAEIVGVNHLTISFPFTSPTMEALGVKRPALYYVPNGKFQGSYFDSLPDVVARNGTQLLSLSKKFLYEIPLDEVERQLEKNMLGRIAPYLDGRALTRFRNLLSQT